MAKRIAQQTDFEVSCASCSKVYTEYSSLTSDSCADRVRCLVCFFVFDLDEERIQEHRECLGKDKDKDKATDAAMATPTSTPASTLVSMSAQRTKISLVDILDDSIDDSSLEFKETIEYKPATQNIQSVSVKGADAQSNLLESYVQYDNTKALMKCVPCDKSYTTTRGLKYHMDSIHLRTRLHRCSYPGCSYSSVQKTDLQKHQSSHEKIPKYSCTVDENCDYNSSFKQGLIHHIKANHMEDKPYACPYCPYRCVTKQMLKYHLESSIHMKRKSFSCPEEECSFGAISDSKLQLHVKSAHLKLKTLFCSDCQKGFTRKFDLIRHEQSIHSLKKQFLCAKCMASFSRKDSLKRHEVVHLP